MTKFYTSYFSNYRKFPENAKLFSVQDFIKHGILPIFYVTIEVGIE